jgi:addiction module RelE/StbE family toxin
MVIKTTNSFDKQYAKLTREDQQRFKNRIQLFQTNPFDRLLNNHGLKGKYLGYRSIDVRGDLRALYKVEGNVIIIFAFIGSHSQLYG